MDSREVGLCRENEPSLSPKWKAEDRSVFESTDCEALEEDCSPDNVHSESHGEEHNQMEAVTNSHKDEWTTSEVQEKLLAPPPESAHWNAQEDEEFLTEDAAQCEQQIDIAPDLQEDDWATQSLQCEIQEGHLAPESAQEGHLAPESAQWDSQGEEEDCLTEDAAQCGQQIEVPPDSQENDWATQSVLCETPEENLAPESAHWNAQEDEEILTEDAAQFEQQIEVAPYSQDDWATQSAQCETQEGYLAPESAQWNVQEDDCVTEESAPCEVHDENIPAEEAAQCRTQDEVDNLFFCSACDVQLKDEKAYHNHTRSMIHTIKAGQMLNDEAEKRDVLVSAGDQRASTVTQPGSEELVWDDDAGNQLLSSDALDSSDTDSEDCSWLKDAEGEVFYCEVCDCCMTGASSYQSHTEGSRHLKNVKSVSLGVPIKKPKGKLAVGSHLAKIVDRRPLMQDMIDSCKKPLIGLQYITEYCHDSDSVEPRYACGLCEAMCDIRMLLRHLTGLKHRINYMKKKGYTNYIILIQQSNRKSCQSSAAEEYSVEIEAKEGRQKMVVRLEEGFVASAPLTNQLEPDKADKISSVNKEDASVSDADSSQKDPSNDAEKSDPFKKFVASSNNERNQRPRKHSRNGSSGEKREHDKQRQLPNPYADAAEMSIKVYPHVRSSHDQYRKDVPRSRMSPHRLKSPPTSNYFAPPVPGGFYPRTGRLPPPHPVTSRLPPPRLAPPVQPFMAPVYVPPPVTGVFQQPLPTSVHLASPVRFSPTLPVAQDVSRPPHGFPHVSPFPTAPIHREPYRVPPPLPVSIAYGPAPSLGPPIASGPPMAWGLPPPQAQGPPPMLAPPMSSGPPPAMGPPPQSLPPASFGPPPAVGLPAGPSGPYSFSASVLARPLSLNSYDVGRLPPPPQSSLDPYTMRQPEPTFTTGHYAVPDSSLNRQFSAAASQLYETRAIPPTIMHPPTAGYSSFQDSYNLHSVQQPNFREEYFPPLKRGLYEEHVGRHNVGTLASEVSGRLANSEQEAFEMSRVIAEAVMKYKSSKGHPQPR